MAEENDFKFEEINVARKVRNACIHAARKGFQDASMRGLCAEGAMEAAISAMQSLKLGKVIKREQNV